MAIRQSEEPPKKMTPWYVEYKVGFKQYWKGGIMARDGREAIQYVQDHVIGAWDFHVWHDDGED